MKSAEELRALIQGSEEWALEKAGYASASEASAILAKGQGKTRLAYLRRIVAERLTGKPSENGGYGSWAKNLERGKTQEPFARMGAEARLDCVIEEVGIIRHPMLMASCSPDGLIDDDGGAEIKSVLPTVQIDTILQGGYPSEHKAQIMFSLWVTGRKYWNFVSFSPDLPENLRLYVFRVVRDEAYIKELQSAVIAFLLECKELEDKLRGMK